MHRDYAKELPRIDAFGSELNQVWTNIVDNAIYAMDGQGEMSIRTYPEDSWVSVEIKDSGPGIPQDTQSNIFDPFFTTKPPGDGAGLGLYIISETVSKLYGSIDLQSEEGMFTRFIITLPNIDQKVRSRRATPVSLHKLNTPSG